MKSKLGVTIALILLAVGKMSAATLYVDSKSLNPTPPYSSWATAATNIQDAVDAAPSGGLVFVTNGLYTGGVVVNQPLVLMSANGAQLTIINGGGTNRCLSLTNGGLVWGFTFTNGYANTGGGVLGGDTNCFLTNCVITGNSAGTGGGVYGATLYNCLLTGNTARGNGSGGGATDSTLYNCTVSANSAAQAGGVFQSTLYNCIVYDNTAASEPNFFASTLNYCCTIPLPASGVGNITNAPLFVNEAGGDFRLRVGSPCIDAGNNAYTAANGLVDLAGNPRIAGAAVDMGAYEHSGAGGGLVGHYVMNFQFSGFAPSNGNPAPTDPVIGSIGWQAGRINGPIQKFDSINLTLDGHTYSPNELDPGSSLGEVHANSLGLPGVDTLTDGFQLFWDQVSLQPIAFDYSSSRRSGIWSPSSFTSFSIISQAEPVIAVQPLSQTVVAGTNVSLSVGASGSLPLYWQWMFNGNTIKDATNSSLELPSIALGQAGAYSVILSNSFGVTTSSNAMLTVLLAGTKYVWQESPNPTAPYTNWATAAHGIQDAVDVAAPGDTILVTNGLYSTGSRALPFDSPSRVVVTNGLDLRSVNGPQFTVIDGGGTNRCIALASSNLVLAGFTLTNGYASEGGGAAGFSLLTNCVVTGNQAEYGGGADSCILYNCTLTGNSLTPGFTNGCAVNDCTLYNCILTDNSGQRSAVADFSKLFGCLIRSNAAFAANNCNLYNCTVTSNHGGLKVARFLIVLFIIIFLSSSGTMGTRQRWPN